MWTTLWRQCFFSYKGLFTWLNWPAYISNVLIRPALMVTIFALVGRFGQNEGAAFNYVVGMSVFSMINIILAGVLQSFSGERTYGTYSILLASRGSRFQAFFSRSVLHYPNGVLNISVSLLWAYLVLGVSFSQASWPAVCLTYLCLIASTTFLSLFLSNFAIPFRNWSYFMSVTTFLVMALTGVVIPRESLPAGLFYLSEIVPISHGLAAVREAFAGAGLGDVLDKIVLELAIGSCYAVGGYLVFGAIERHAVRTGAYDASEV